MRIAVMVDRLEVGGVEKVAMQQVKALRAAGQDAVLVMLKRRGEGLEAYREELAALPALVLEDRLPPPLRVSVGVPGFSFLETFHLTFPLLARRMVRPGEFDVILCHGSYTCLTAYAIRRTRGIPVAGLIWDPTFHVVSGPAYAGRALGRLRFLLAPLTRRFDRWLVRTPDLVVLGGLAYRDYVAALGPRRLLIQHPAVEVSASVRPASERRPEILAVTAWKHGKQPARLLGLIERHPGMRLVLAGAWLDEALLREFTAEVEPGFRS